MEKARLLEHYYAMAKPMERTVADEQGNVLFPGKPTSKGQYDNSEINRNDLKQLLLNSLASDTLIGDRRITGLDEQNGKWLLQFDNRVTATAEVVIGANGGMSKVRKQVTDAEIEYTGTLIIQGEVWQPEMTCMEFLQLCNDPLLNDRK